MQRVRWFSAIVATAAAGMLAGMLLVPRGSLTAQGQQGPPAAGRPGAGPMGQGQMPPGMMMRMAPAAIAATDNHVYVLRGNTLYQFSARDLGEPKKVTLEEPEMMPGMGGRPGRPGAVPGGPPPAP